MTVKELNYSILYEKTMAELADDFKKAEKEFRYDLNKRITLDEIKFFIKKWRFFTNNHIVSNKKISDIEKKGKAILKYLNTKINRLKMVKSIDINKIKPMEKYLEEFALEIKYHLKIQKEIYNYNARSKGEL